jgi:hypothetical protein
MCEGEKCREEEVGLKQLAMACFTLLVRCKVDAIIYGSVSRDRHPPKIWFIRNKTSTPVALHEGLLPRTLG